MGYTDRSLDVLLARLALLVCLAVAAVGCATTGAVPRPFPGAQPAPAKPAPAEPPAPVAVAPEPMPSTAATPVVPAPLASAPLPSLNTPGAQALASALQLQGVRYRSGGSDPSGFDCSGLVQWVFARQGIAMPREVRYQFQVGYEIDADEVQPGDLLFFNTESDGASHVGIAIDGASFVHAPNSRGVVRVERLSTTYWSQRLIGARRIE